MSRALSPPRVIPHLRWWIGGLLFASTVINYIDRQALSVLAPYLKAEYRWTNADFALLIISFRVAYSLGQSAMGRVLDRIGTRRGLLLSVTWYSLAAAATSLATGLRSFAAFRFLLGLGESGNWPGATKAVSEWFPKQERGWAVALFDSGSAIGGAVAPALVLWLYASFGDWRPAFLVTGALGLVWLALWRRMYHSPETHPNISAKERSYILASREPETDSSVEGVDGRARGAASLLRLRETWAVILGRSLTDPVWFFITDWFAVYLVAKGFRLEESLAGFWIPFLAADLGNFAGGGCSSALIARGWPVVRARKLVIGICGLGMAGLIPAAFSSSFPVLVSLFAISTFCYAAWSTMGLSLPADLFPNREVASVSGFGGTGAGLGTIASTYLIGQVADRFSFEPVLIGASLLPLAATGLVMVLLREPARRRTA